MYPLITTYLIQIPSKRANPNALQWCSENIFCEYEEVDERKIRMQAARGTPPAGNLALVHMQQAPLQQEVQQKQQQAPLTLRMAPRRSCREGARESGRSRGGACEDRADLRDHIPSCCREMSTVLMKTNRSAYILTLIPRTPCLSKTCLTA